MAQSARSFVGRDSELQTLTGLLGVVPTASTTGGAGARRQHVLLAGDAGVGKTRLLTALRDRALTDGWQVHAGHCVDFGESAVAYMPFSEILDRIVADLPDVVERVAADYPALARLRPVRRVMGANQGTAAAGTDRGQLFDAVHTLFEAAAEKAPLLVVVEDTHWADQSTRDLLTYLFTRPYDGPVAMVVSYRADDIHRRHPLRRQVGEWGRLPDVERIVLEPLSDDSVRRLVHELASGKVDAERVVRRAEGNAFFVEELVQAGCDEDLPVDLADLLLVRLDRLDGAARSVVRTASIAGRRVTHELLAAVTEMKTDELDDALRTAVEQKVLEPTGSRYTFRHALLAEAVYDDLLPGEKVRLHARFAEVLKETPGLGAAAELALHAKHAGDLATALRARIAAAEEARNVSGVGEAAHHYEKALGLAADPKVADAAGVDLDRVYERAADTLILAGLPSRADAILAERLDAIPAGRTVGRALLLATRAEAAFAMENGDPLTYSRAAIDALPDDAEPKARCVVLAVRTRTLVAYRRSEEAEAVGLEGIEIAERHSLSKLASDMATSLSMLKVRTGRAGGDKVEGFRQVLRETIDQARRVGSTYAVSRGLFALGRSYDEAGDYAEALNWFRAVIDDAGGESLQWSLYVAAARADIVRIQMVLGEWEEALALAGGNLPDAPPVPVALLDILRMMMEQAQGASVGEAAAALRPFWTQEGLIALYGATVEMVAAGRAGDHAAVFSIYADTVETLSQFWTEWFGGRVRLAVVAASAIAQMLPSVPAVQWPALVEAVDGLHSDGEQVIAQYQPGEWGPEGRAWAARLEAEVLRVHWLAGIDAPLQESLLAAWMRAEQQVEAYGDVPGLAAVRTTYAVIQRATGDVAGSRATADKARETAKRLRLQPLLDELRSLGATAVKQHQTTPTALTPRESEILTLVAAGRSNGEIGKQLFISTKTVSVHVSNILGKLGAGSRTEAAAIARRQELIS
ncbi:helix-turn-helix transcriptional regulator [Nocardioides albus]|uniref:DNA-binding CsgD family transcriptional regulator/tetratricopeptide (TPR) repeat protein n=1 Tax=Nocardioides albus TaxID=1841 RepID=A0A7W5A773_9ACTN|nr:AAA family ATPase [Nocardioides albus]MBB3090664.1 DNA-binding CsgD family transcriptional regulator/tetratricopeptide (TPR) repeat protein [Nocardioides albus]GGU25580.1 LuxR family transcriptional regulator [Nocardioides albus]